MTNEVFGRIDNLITTQKKKKNDLNDYLGVTHSMYNNWRNGSSTSYYKYIDKIAEFLNVTPNYLLCGSDSFDLQETQVRKYEAKILNILRNIPEKECDRLIKIIDAFVSTIEDCAFTIS